MKSVPAKTAAKFALVAIAVFPVRAWAGNFFDITATGTDDTMVSAGGSNIINLTDNLIKEQSQFASLAGQGFTGSLSYGGVPNAIQLAMNPSQTQATLTLLGNPTPIVFNGTNQADLQNQIKAWIKKNGAGTYANFVQAIDGASPVAAIDGNPQAATAFIASDAFDRFAVHDALSQAELTGEGGDHSCISLSGTGGTTAAAGLDGYYGDFALDLNLRFTSNVDLSLATIGQYRSVENSSAYTVGEMIGLPITIANRDGPGFGWQITPWGFAALAGSYDQATGTMLWGGGITSCMSYQIGDFTLALNDQYSYETDRPVHIAGYDFDAKVNQTIAKNGGKIVYQPGQGMFFIDGAVTWTKMFNNARVPNYLTASAGIGLSFAPGTGIRIGYTGDWGSDYHSTGGEIQLYFTF